VVAPLASEFEVITVDLPGFGDSPPLEDGASPGPVALARVLGDFLDARGLAAAHLAGSSLGAWIALELARLGRARSVTSLCAAGFWPRPLLADGEVPRKPGRALARALLPVMGPLLRTRRGRRVVLGLTMAHPERVTRAEALDIVRAYAAAPGYPATNLAMRRGHFAGAEGIDVPVTLAWGEHDRLVRPPVKPPPGWRTVLMPDCGHLAMWDDPELVVRVIRATARPT
jgi:pimeloyl-ACP methyl ester carboxylesterase